MVDHSNVRGQPALLDKPPQVWSRRFLDLDTYLNAPSQRQKLQPEPILPRRSVPGYVPASLESSQYVARRALGNTKPAADFRIGHARRPLSNSLKDQHRPLDC